MTYWLGALRAANNDGRRMSSTGRRAKITMEEMRKTLGKGTKLCTKGVSEQIQRYLEVMNGFPFMDVRSSSGKSCVVSGPSRMATMISNKMYKPGD